MRRGRTSKARGKNILPSEELAQNEMSWGGEGEGRRGARTSRTGVGLSSRTGSKMGASKTSSGVGRGKKSTTRSLSRQSQATAPLRRGKSKRTSQSSKKSVASKGALGRTRGRATGGRKSSRTRRSRAT